MRRRVGNVGRWISVVALVLGVVGLIGMSAAGTSVFKGPSSAEKKLLASVPSSIRPSCHPGKPVPQGSFAAIYCDDGSGNTLSYNQYRKAGAMDDWYSGEVDTNSVPALSHGHTPGDCPFNNNYTTKSGHKGHVLCLREGDGSAWYEWADQPTLIFAIAIRKDGDAKQLEDFFQRAGPCLRREKSCLTQ
jgi:hypothetical protein